MRRRVAITGLGVFSSIGTGAAEFAASLRAGASGRAPLTAFDAAGYAHSFGCPVAPFDPSSWLHRVRPAELGRAAQFAASAGRMAMADAGLTEAELRAARCHVCVGTTEGGSFELDQLTEAWLADGPERLDPVLARQVPAQSLSVAMACELGLADAEISTLGTACSAGNYAIGDGFDAIATGEAEFAVCGGADAIARKTFTTFYRLGLVTPDHCRPFDSGRQGILIGEGAGVVLLESLDSARARGARVYAEVLGYGLNCDAFHPTAPDRASLARCMELALRDAGVKREEVDLISAHGTGTRANDSTEVSAIRDVYGSRVPPVIGLKSMLGHAMGAASALSAIACALAITGRFIPPTINHRQTDPDCAIDCVPNTAVDADLHVVQNNGFAFAGNNAIVILGKHEAIR
ncbi:MAG TPA: beta-ketoacyl-[acyl-carrier-protein] synthase family protein [Streptosporangiaceae bacterium]